MPESSDYEEYLNLTLKVVLDEAELSAVEENYLAFVQRLIEEGMSINDALAAGMKAGRDGFAFGDVDSVARLNKEIINTADSFGEAAEYAEEYVHIEEQIAIANEEIVTSSEGVTVATEQVAQAQGEAAEKVRSTGGEVDGLGNKGQNAFQALVAWTKNWFSSLTDVGTIMKGLMAGFVGATAAQAVIQGIQMVTQYLGEAVDVAAKFEKTMVAIEIGVRAMQRSGLDVTMEDTFGEMERLREEYAIFSEQDMAAGTETFVNNMREMGVSQSQLTDLMGLSAKAAVLSGKSYEDTTRIINLAVLTGYSRTLNTQLRGINFTTKLAQAEAERLGIVGKTFEQMSAQERTMVTISLLSREMAAYDEDIAEMKKTQAYQLQAAESSLQTIKKDLGESVLPIWVDILKVVKVVVEHLSLALTIIFDMVKALIAVGELLYNIGEFNNGLIPPENLQKQWQEVIDTAEHGADAVMKLLHLDDLLGIKLGYDPQLGNLSPEEIAAAEEEIQTTRVENQEEFAAESLKIETERLEKIEDANIKYQRKLLDIDRDANRKREEAAIKLSYDLEQIDRDAAYSKLKAREDYDREVIQAERDLQFELLRLREQALFDVEEAVRRNDIRQVRLILRQYRYDKNAAISTFDKEKADRRNALAEEIADIEAQRIKKRKERMIDYEQQMADIDAWQAYERESARRAYERLLQDIEEAAKREIEILRKKFQQELSDMQAALQQKINMNAQANAQMARDNAKSQTTQPAAGSPNANRSVVLPQGTVVGSGIGASVGVPTFARGGSMLATRPTLAMFGEAGAELATFTPISSIGKNGGNGQGRLAIEILLSPELESNIVENTLTEVGNIISSVERSR